MSEKNESKPPFFYFALATLAIILMVIFFTAMEHEIDDVLKNNPAHLSK